MAHIMARHHHPQFAAAAGVFPRDVVPLGPLDPSRALHCPSVHVPMAASADSNDVVNPMSPSKDLPMMAAFKKLKKEERIARRRSLRKRKKKERDGNRANSPFWVHQACSPHSLTWDVGIPRWSSSVAKPRLKTVEKLEGTVAGVAIVVVVQIQGEDVAELCRCR